MDLLYVILIGIGCFSAGVFLAGRIKGILGMIIYFLRGGIH